MKQPWIFWTASALIVGSIIYELVTGTARVRGMREYSRNERPGAYWIVIVLKGLLAVLVTAIGFAQP